MRRLPTAHRLYEVIEETWPSAGRSRQGPFFIHEGQGGGKRVSAAVARGPAEPGDIPPAEDAMRSLGQVPLFMIREGDEALDTLLDRLGYRVLDPVNMYAAPAEAIATKRPPRTVAIPAWEPLRIMEEIWADGGIGPGRVAVMHRACEPKTGFVSRWRDSPAGAGFVAMYDGIAMVHALEILPFQRREGLARWMMQRAAFWTLEEGGHTLSVVCTRDNEGANALYASLGMTLVGQYHYRQKT
ncbi:Acetyltransferase (GNAT) family protein [Salinihabitans flavidus]|uniref:Acetyltransferase (GNAT) family protein n=1 Tax=Salinihabitans flavidus TaxID=569882 RepID=A0A1H8UUA5_9RHOB|nr:GNAT family N-acetyltransferase [Salinihabitans flavidus]SEP06583.1 Acetyltransferase (GNAT) family protein [Salinihabitans flavidus]